ncbi:MAG: tyrosine-type recombinase/integrase [Desulfomonilaceae bacterium]
MAVRQKGKRFYVYFKWNGALLETATSAQNEANARRIDRAVRTALRINRFDHLKPDEQEFIVRTFQNKRWKLPPDLAISEPMEELTLEKATKEYLQADEKHRRERNIFAVVRLLEHFGKDCPLADIKVPQIKRYRQARLEKVKNATVNREVAVLSGIFRVQLELEAVDYNPCRMVKILPEEQRDTYLSWSDFNLLLENADWLQDVLVLLYYTGMRFGEAVNLRWEMYKPDRRMLILPPSATKEGKNERKAKVKPKRVPLRNEVVDVLESLRTRQGDNVVQAVGLVFGYCGNFNNRADTYQGKPIDRSMVRKCWARAIKRAGLKGLQFRDFRHTWKTNAQRSGIDPAVRNAIVGHASVRPVEERYIHISDEELLQAVESLTFEHGRTQLDFVEEAVMEAPPQKGMEGVWKSTENCGSRKNQGAAAHCNTLIYNEIAGRDDWI